MSIGSVYGAAAMKESLARWAALSEIYLCMLSAALAMQSIPPVMSLLIHDFRLSHHQGGMLMSLFALPAIFVSLPAGMLADRYGIREVGIIGLGLTGLGSALVATSGSFVALASGRVIAGMGSIMIVVISAQGIARWFAGREMGVAMGIFNTATPVGLIASLNVISVMASRWGWRSGIWATVVFTAVSLVVFSLFFTSPGKEAPDRRTASRAHEDIGKDGLAIWLVALCWALFTSSIISLFSFAPDFMVSRGLALQTAGFYTSLVMAGSLFLSPIIGHGADKYGHQEAFIAVGGLGMAILLLVVPADGSHFALLMVVIGILAAFVPAPVYSRAAQVVSPERLGWAFGLIAMLNNVGVFVGPQLVGLSRDVTGSYQAGFGLMALFSASAAITGIILRVRRRQRALRTP